MVSNDVSLIVAKFRFRRFENPGKPSVFLLLAHVNLRARRVRYKDESFACRHLEFVRHIWMRVSFFCHVYNAPIKGMEAYGAQLHPAGYSLTAYQENRKPRYLRATQFSAFGTVASQIGKDHLPNGAAIHREQVPTAIRIPRPLMPGRPP